MGSSFSISILLYISSDGTRNSFQVETGTSRMRSQPQDDESNDSPKAKVHYYKLVSPVILLYLPVQSVTKRILV